MSILAKYNVQGFTTGELEYYSRQIALQDVGLTGQKRLKEAKVCVVGLGGLGSPISIQLASIGVGHLRIVDRDIVETSNLQRQHLYGVNKIGYPKVEAAVERLRDLNPFIDFEPIPMSLTPKNAEDIISGMDVVVDGLDRMTPRYALNRACLNLGIPLVFGAVITNVGNISTIMPGETACVECFQGNINDDELPNCALVGVNPSIIGIIASIQVSEAIRLILGRKPNLANILMYCDLSDLSFEKIQLKKSESCPVCGSKPKTNPMPLRREEIEEICGREERRVFIFSPDECHHVDLNAINLRLRQLGYSLTVEAKLGTSFVRGMTKGSILRSGVLIIEGVNGPDEAISLRDDLLMY